MTTKDTTLLQFMNVLFWIIFIGLCIKTGAMLISFLISIFVTSVNVENLYLDVNLRDIDSLKKIHYYQIMTLVIALTAFKAYVAYLVVKIFSKLNLSNPFNSNITKLIYDISRSSFVAGILAIIISGYSKWLLKKSVQIPIDWDGGEILFFAGVIYIIALVFKKGTELQTENDLTV